MTFLKNVFFISALILAIHAAAENQCRAGGFTSYSDDYYVYEVITDKAFYYYDWEECPVKGDCKKSRYLEKGEAVIVSKTLDKQWACVRNLDQNKVRHGWVKLEKLVNNQSEEIKFDDSSWNGLWVDSKNAKIEFKRIDNKILVQGSAVWVGGKYASNNEGGVNGTLNLSSDRLSSYVESGKEDYDCRVDMKLISKKYMLVTDNKKCGGSNVRFDGVYIRTK